MVKHERRHAVSTITLSTCLKVLRHFRMLTSSNSLASRVRREAIWRLGLASKDTNLAIACPYRHFISEPPCFRRSRTGQRRA